jgi:TatD DNase family protein
VVAVGECGLDYYYEHSPRAVQMEIFARQIGVANERDLPLVIHTRDAWEDTFEILDREGVPANTIFHCFTGGPDELDDCVARGGFISFSGIVTFPSASELRLAALRCPLDRMLIETDAPYLAPVPFRGQRNRPAWVTAVGAGLADLRGDDLGTIASATVSNAFRAFRLDQYSE